MSNKESPILGGQERGGDESGGPLWQMCGKRHNLSDDEATLYNEKREKYGVPAMVYVEEGGGGKNTKKFWDRNMPWTP